MVLNWLNYENKLKDEEEEKTEVLNRRKERAEKNSLPDKTLKSPCHTIIFYPNFRMHRLLDRWVKQCWEKPMCILMHYYLSH